MATVLEIVQETMSLMDSDSVNSISDTTESYQVAMVVKQCFDDLVDRFELVRSKDTFQLISLADTSYPTTFNIPTNVNTIEWVAYDTRSESDDPTSFRPLKYLTPAEFMELCAGRDSTLATTTGVVLDSGITVLIANDKAPEFYTTFSDTQIMLDSYDSGLETYQPSTKTSCYGETQLQITLDDTTNIPLTANLINLLKKDVIELAFEVWKEGAPLRIRQDALRARVKAQRRKRRLQINQERDLFTGPNYGRRV